MKYTVKEVLQFVEGNDVRFVRLAFFDVFGKEKNITVMAGELKTVFEKGMPVSAGMIDGLESSDVLLLFPDPNTLKVVTWRPQQGAVVRLLCMLRREDGSPVASDVRQITRTAAEKLKSTGLNAFVGISGEFMLFHTDENGEPTERPHDGAGYLDCSPMDRGAVIRGEICTALTDMEITPLLSCHKAAPGQNEIMLRHVDIMTAADQYPLFQSVVRCTALSDGLSASFMTKPTPGGAVNELKLSVILAEAKQNLLTDRGREMGRKAQSFLAGMLRRSTEVTLFCRPDENDYSSGIRVYSDGWSYDNGQTMLQVQLRYTERARLEIRGMSPSCNLYLVLALLMQAGVEGIAEELPLKEPSKGEWLPDSRQKAVKAAQNSSFLQKILPEEILGKYLNRE